MRNFKQLRVWQDAISVVECIYQLTAEFPGQEKYGLVSQLRRCAVSVPSNIAEGCGRTSDPDFARFLDVANGSAFELETQLIIAQKLYPEYLPADLHSTLLDEVRSIQKRIFGLQKSLK
jgi:four helix bundle protein